MWFRISIKRQENYLGLSDGPNLITCIIKIGQPFLAVVGRCDDDGGRIIREMQLVDPEDEWDEPPAKKCKLPLEVGKEKNRDIPLELPEGNNPRHTLILAEWDLFQTSHFH